MANTNTHPLSAKSGSKTVKVKLGDRRVAFRQTMMSAVCGYRYPSFTPGASYGIFSLLDPDTKANEQLFMSFLGNFSKAAVCFIKEYTESNDSIGVSGVYSSVATTLSDGGNSLGFPTNQTTIVGDNGKHYIGSPERKLCVFRTPWVIPEGTKAILFAFTYAGITPLEPKLPITNHGKTIVLYDRTPAAILLEASAGKKFNDIALAKSYNLVYDTGSVLNGSSGTISKWAFKY